MAVTPQETAATLRQRSAEARSKAKIRAATVRGLVMSVVRQHLPTGGSAWLIGSLAWGGFGERSDIDLVTAGVDARQATTIEIALCKAAGVEVDVLMLQDLPQAFRDRVAREGIAIHGG